MNRSLKTQYFLARAIYGGGNLLLDAGRRLLYRRPPENPSTILLFRSGHLGDSFCALPAASALRERFPRARLILLTVKTSGPGPAEVLDGLIGFDRVITFDPPGAGVRRMLRGLRREIERERVDLLVYLPHYLWSLRRQARDMVLFRLAGCPSAIGFKWSKHAFFSAAQARYRSFPSEGLRLLELLRPLGIREPGRKWRDLSRGRRPAGRGRIRLALHTGAKFPVNQWPAEHYRRLVRLLRDRLRPSLVLVGDASAAGVDLGEEISSSPDVRDLRGKTDWSRLLETLRDCDLLITTDSGPGHVAAAAGTPVVGIYSARDYRGCWYPLGDNNVILRRDPSCQVCLRVDCRTRECLLSITPEEVLAACENVLSRRKGENNATE